MTIDTGSSDIYIKGEHSRGVPGKRYVCGQWCIDNLPHYEIEYLDGKLETYAKNLEVKFGNHVFKESILVTYEVGKNFESSGGLVGLSFPSLAINPEPNFLQTLINNKIIAHYSFGVLLNA